MTANIDGEDLGHAAQKVAAAIRSAGEPPRGVTVDVRGQTVPLSQMFQGLSVRPGDGGAR
jgi:sulfur carrier protein ThiS